MAIFVLRSKRNCDLPRQVNVPSRENRLNDMLAWCKRKREKKRKLKDIERKATLQQASIRSNPTSVRGQLPVPPPPRFYSPFQSLSASSCHAYNSTVASKREHVARLLTIEQSRVYIVGPYLWNPHAIPFCPYACFFSFFFSFFPPFSIDFITEFYEVTWLDIIRTKILFQFPRDHEYTNKWFKLLVREDIGPRDRTAVGKFTRNARARHTWRCIFSTLRMFLKLGLV